LLKIFIYKIIPSISSGLVSSLTRIDFSPLAFISLTYLVLKAINPVAAPGLAANPLPRYN